MAIANCLSTIMTFGIHANNSQWPDVSTSEYVCQIDYSLSMEVEIEVTFIDTVRYLGGLLRYKSECQ